jgi:hypothetical protein
MAEKKEQRKNIIIIILVVIIILLLKGCNPLTGGSSGGSGGISGGGSCPVCKCDNPYTPYTPTTPCTEGVSSCTDSRGTHLNTCSNDNIDLVSYRCSPDLGYCVGSSTRCSDMNSINRCMPDSNGALCGVPYGSGGNSTV